MTRWEWEKSLREDRQLEAGLKYVGLMLATFGNANGGEIFPSTATLAEACAMNPKTVRKHREHLVMAGWIECVRGGGGRGLSNKYRLTLPSESLPMNGSLSRINPGTRQPETLPNNGSVYGSETLPTGAAKASQIAPLNPTNGWEGTSTDQTTRPKDVSAGPRSEAPSVRGFEDVAEIAWHRRSADARDGDDAMQVSR
jgi:hypothetical protein